jgi:hypothetical protein
MRRTLGTAHCCRFDTEPVRVGHAPQSWDAGARQCACYVQADCTAQLPSRHANEVSAWECAVNQELAERFAKNAIQGHESCGQLHNTRTCHVWRHLSVVHRTRASCTATSARAILLQTLHLVSGILSCSTSTGVFYSIVHVKMLSDCNRAARGGAITAVHAWLGCLRAPQTRKPQHLDVHWTNCQESICEQRVVLRPR